jgi:hypothetical protein
MDDGVATGLEEDFEGEEARPKGKGGLPKIAAAGLAGIGALVVIGVLLLIWKAQLNQAAKVKRDVADQIFTTVALKWKLEADCMKECEERFALLRTPESAAQLSRMRENPAGFEKTLRVWVYYQREYRDKVLDGNLEIFQKYFNADTDGLAYAKAGEHQFYAEDFVLDWLANRGYKIFENLKKVGKSPSLASGGTIDSQGNGALRLTIFGAPLTAECLPDESMIDIDRGVASIAFTTNYLSLLGTGTAPATLIITGNIKDNRWTFDFTKEIGEHLASAGDWATKRFEAGGAGAAAEAK